MPFLSPSAKPAEIPTPEKPENNAAWYALSSTEQVAKYTQAGYTIMQDGMSGTQLIAPRKMRGADLAILIIGGVLLFMPPLTPLGVLFIIAALIDYYVIVKRPTVFIPRR